MVQKQNVTETALQELINDVEGVVSSKVKLDDTGNLVEIHALADKSRNAKQIVRDIQSAVTAKFDLEIDHRIISIAQLSCDSVMQKDLRIVFKGMEVASKGLELDVKVMLSHREKDYCGSQKGINTTTSINRTIAQATLKALSDFLNIGGIFVVEDVGTLNIAKTNVVVVAVTCVDKNGEQLLIGSSMNLGDIKEAVVKATLDAVNRRITKLMGR
ncbi:MAG: hypothetical protein GX918_05545 [Clostridiales bacterium]|nr:hypothetical protein [Clostridiales bacterium]